MNKPLTIFGREPAVIVGALEALIAALLAFGLGISPESYGPWVALVVAVGGALTAVGTKDTLLGAVIGAIKAAVVLVAVYGLTLTDQQTGAIIGIVSMAFGFYQRTQTSPVTPPWSQQALDAAQSDRLTQAIRREDAAMRRSASLRPPLDPAEYKEGPVIGEGVENVGNAVREGVERIGNKAAAAYHDGNPGGGDHPRAGI